MEQLAKILGSVKKIDNLTLITDHKAVSGLIAIGSKVSNRPIIKAPPSPTKTDKNNNGMRSGATEQENAADNIDSSTASSSTSSTSATFAASATSVASATSACSESSGSFTSYDSDDSSKQPPPAAKLLSKVQSTGTTEKSARKLIRSQRRRRRHEKHEGIDDQHDTVSKVEFQRTNLDTDDAKLFNKPSDADETVEDKNKNRPQPQKIILQPRKFPKTSKEKRIDAGLRKCSNEYATFDDVVSDWTVTEEKMKREATFKKQNDEIDSLASPPKDCCNSKQRDKNGKHAKEKTSITQKATFEVEKNKGTRGNSSNNGKRGINEKASLSTQNSSKDNVGRNGNEKNILSATLPPNVKKDDGLEQRKKKKMEASREKRKEVKNDTKNEDGNQQKDSNVVEKIGIEKESHVSTVTKIKSVKQEIKRFGKETRKLRVAPLILDKMKAKESRNINKDVNDESIVGVGKFVESQRGKFNVKYDGCIYNNTIKLDEMFVGRIVRFVSKQNGAPRKIHLKVPETLGHGLPAPLTFVDK